MRIWIEDSLRSLNKEHKYLLSGVCFMVYGMICIVLAVGEPKTDAIIVQTVLGGSLCLKSIFLLAVPSVHAHF